MDSGFSCKLHDDFHPCRKFSPEGGVDVQSKIGETMQGDWARPATIHPDSSKAKQG